MILLKQAKNDREELVHLLGLSKELEKYLVNPEKEQVSLRLAQRLCLSEIRFHTKPSSLTSWVPIQKRWGLTNDTRYENPKAARKTFQSSLKV